MQTLALALTIVGSAPMLHAAEPGPEVGVSPTAQPASCASAHASSSAHTILRVCTRLDVVGSVSDVAARRVSLRPEARRGVGITWR